MNRRSDNSNRRSVAFVIVLGVAVGIAGYGCVMLLKALSIGPNSRGPAGLLGPIVAYGGCHAPWLVHLITGWPKSADSLGTLIVNVVYYPSLFLGIRSVFRRFRRQEPDDAPRCHACEYNLTGNVSGTCPECGATVQTPETEHEIGHLDAK